jgi:hypothetical protein
MILQVLSSLIGRTIINDTVRYQLISHLIKNRAFYYRVYHLAGTLNNIKIRDAASAIHQEALLNQYRKSSEKSPHRKELQRQANDLYNFLDHHPELKPTIINMLTNGSINLKSITESNNE